MRSQTTHQKRMNIQYLAQSAAAPSPKRAATSNNQAVGRATTDYAHLGTALVKLGKKIFGDEQNNWGKLTGIGNDSNSYRGECIPGA